MSLGSDEKRTGEEESDCVVLAPDLIRIIECSILSFRQFMKMHKKKLGGFRNLFGSQNQRATPLQQIQSSHEKVSSIFHGYLYSVNPFNCQFD